MKEVNQKLNELSAKVFEQNGKGIILKFDIKNLSDYIEAKKILHFLSKKVHSDVNTIRDCYSDKALQGKDSYYWEDTPDLERVAKELGKNHTEMMLFLLTQALAK